MSKQEQLIKLLINNSLPGWEIEAVHSRCCIYFGVKSAFGACQEIIDFALEAKIGALESFRLQVELAELTGNSTDF